MKTTDFHLGEEVRILAGNGWLEPGIYTVSEIHSEYNHAIRVKGRSHNHNGLWIKLPYIEKTQVIYLGGE